MICEKNDILYKNNSIDYNTKVISMDNSRSDDSSTLSDRDTIGRYNPDGRYSDIRLENAFEKDENNYMINIFRYKFTQEFITPLYEFSKIHQYDHRSAFKEAWTQWVEENQDLIHSEIERLTILKYEGDVLDKMFKSARYYFRKKSTKKTEPVDRRDYIGIQQELLESMDSHILNHIKEEDFKPSKAFIHYCNESRDLLKNEMIRMLNNKIPDSLIQEKIKKTYKNRYFMFISKNNKNKIE